MKSLCLVSLVLNAALALALLCHPGAERAARAGNIEPVAGDTNGDGRLDISDALRILQFLFGDGPAPEAPTCTGGRALPDTGQTRCFDSTGNVVDCDSPDWPRQDGAVDRDGPGARFVDHGDGTVTDVLTGLMWEQRTAFEDAVNWQDALRYCADLDLGGHADWRLPDIREIQSIVDYDSPSPVFPDVFHALESRYWSSTTARQDPTIAWVVNGLFGQVASVVPKSLPLAFPRAVRSVD